MKRLLIETFLDLPFPDGGSPRLTTFAYQQVTGSEGELDALAVIKVHFHDVIQLEAAPLDVLIAQIRATLAASMSFGRKHLSKLNLTNVSKRRPHAANNLSFVFTNNADGSPNNFSATIPPALTTSGVLKMCGVSSASVPALAN